MSLNNVLRDIARIGPNTWDQVTAADFGFSFDYIIERHGNRVVIDPTSHAALQWCYKHLPEDCPRWGKLGFVIERQYIDPILHAMARDGLLSEEEYVFNMTMEERDRHQGENR